ncbi:MAG: UMP kinase [Nitrososphaerales archaeon]
MNIVVKLSGSLFKPENFDKLKPFKELFENFHDKGYHLILVAGGGDVARKYIEFCRKFQVNEGRLDEIGILASKLNAKLLASLLQDKAYSHIPENLKEVSLALESNKIVCCGGFHPGHSTNAVAALIAEYIKADLFINATDVDGIYDKDPKKYRDAKKIKEIRVQELFKMLSEDKMIAGSYELLDLLSLKILERSKLKAKVLLCEPKEVERALLGEDVGTLIIV